MITHTNPLARSLGQLLLNKLKSTELVCSLHEENCVDLPVNTEAEDQTVLGWAQQHGAEVVGGAYSLLLGVVTVGKQVAGLVKKKAKIHCMLQPFLSAIYIHVFFHILRKQAMFILQNIRFKYVTTSASFVSNLQFIMVKITDSQAFFPT